MWRAALLFLLLGSIVSAQKPKKDEVLFNFNGVLKSVTKKNIVIEPDPENQMTFVRSKRTAFFDAEKNIDGEKIERGTAVAIQAAGKLNGDLEAIVVRIVRAPGESEPPK